MIAAFFHALGAPWRALMTEAGLKAWGVILLAGGGVAMTAMASVAMYLDRDRPEKVFYLGLCAMMLVGIVITGFAGLIIKRDIDLSGLGLKFRISDQQAQQIADKVAAATPPPPPAPAVPSNTTVVIGPPPPATPATPEKPTEP